MSIYTGDSSNSSCPPSGIPPTPTAWTTRSHPTRTCPAPPSTQPTVAHSWRTLPTSRPPGTSPTSHFANGRRLLLRYGYGLTQAEIGRKLGVAQRTAGEWTTEGVGRIVAYLNGDATWEVGAVAA